ncbi:MAG: hypothetical protein KatS3mg071_1992 [Meiothermus sp.]|nr:MAG: hypothetical protein KatS3mg071_1992 [Meiothermus sp.]
MNRAERTLLALHQKTGQPPAACKKETMARFGLTARQFNAVRYELEGKIQAQKEIREKHIQRLQGQIRATKRAVEETEEALKRAKGKGNQKRIRSLRGKLIGKKRRLDILKTRLRNLQAEAEAGRVALCFGGRKLFLAQYHLAKNGLPDHAAWLAKWRKTRSDGFFLLGSGDETNGNQTATLYEEGEEAVAGEKRPLFTLRLRLPEALGGGHVWLRGLRFPYGGARLDEVLKIHEAKKKGEKGPALSCRLVRKAKGWYLHLTVELPDAPIVTDRKRGAVGLDLNPDGIALVEVDKDGNPIHRTFFPLPLQGKTKGQAKALILDAAKALVAHARAVGKPLALERLDFEKKKTELRDRSPGYARMLSSFAYDLMEGAIRARALKEGVEVLAVNPAWTSLLGRVKYQVRYGLSVHESAALVIARRGLGLREEVPRRPVCKTKEGYLFCPWRPARKRVGQSKAWTLKELKGILQWTTSEPPRKRGARRPRRRSPSGTEVFPRVLPWLGPPGPVVPFLTVGDGRASAVK